MFSLTDNRLYSDVRYRSGPIYIDDVQCSSSNIRLIDCFYSWSTSDCSYYNDVGVHCIGKRWHIQFQIPI